ncbi:alpha/beta hydrolase [Aeromicrobium sp. UC242_57]|uniref:alpha/beta hydrolase n=1 Tax=Aeromicrobium sp. UC242_57 TaxID=3374624 RepID=UPI0037B23212
MAIHEYAPGRHLQAFGQPDQAVTLLWHGRGVDHGSSMTSLGRRIAQHGVLALCVDWNSESADGGRTDLLTSVRFARDLATEHDLDPDRLVVAGWSLGGSAALSLATHAKRLGIGLGGVVMIAPGDGERVVEPITAAALPAVFPPGTGRCRIDLVYGERDPLATPDLVAGLELRLRASDWRTSMHSVDADHAGVVGTRFEPRTERYLPSRAADATRAADTVAELVVAATRPSS